MAVGGIAAPARILPIATWPVGAAFRRRDPFTAGVAYPDSRIVETCVRRGSARGSDSHEGRNKETNKELHGAAMLIKKAVMAEIVILHWFYTTVFIFELS